MKFIWIAHSEDKYTLLQESTVSLHLFLRNEYRDNSPNKSLHSDQNYRLSYLTKIGTSLVVTIGAEPKHLSVTFASIREISGTIPFLNAVKESWMNDLFIFSYWVSTVLKISRYLPSGLFSIHSPVIANPSGKIIFPNPCLCT